MSYTIKAFHDETEEIETVETMAIAEKRFNELKNSSCDAVYIYDPNGEMVKSYQDTYLTYEIYTDPPRCVYCGSQSIDGYCWNSPDGFHVLNE